MRTRSAHDARVAEVTRRRLAALASELGADEDDRPGMQSAPPAATGPGRHARRPVESRRRLTGWVSDRAHLGSAQIGVVCLVVAVGLVLAAWWLVRAAGVGAEAGDLVAPRPAEVGTASTSGLSPSPSPALSPSPSEQPAPTEDRIVVDVIGKVRRPGIVVLPAGARVVDAVRAAGGLRRGVASTSVNLARPLTDGEQVAVGVLAAPGSQAGAALADPGPSPGAGPLVNLNTADQAALETLPGVGPVTAAAIVEWRTQHGGFTSVDELLEVSGIGDATLAEIAPHVTL